MAKSIYVHIPFCNKICAYCDFTKFLAHHSYIEPYVNQLVKHIDSKEKFDARTIYLGGGTPTSLPLSLLENVLIALSSYSKEVKEYTIETNVENINIDLINLLKKYNVNRISIGVQTFNDEHLKILNRSHTYNEIIEKINLLKENNFDNLSIDLIYGLPNQTMEEWKKDLEIAMSLPIKHISLYSLMIEEHTVLYLKKYKEQDEDFLNDCYEYAYNYLNKNGFTRYEVSNFAKSSEYESKHNLVYWNAEEYVAFGVGSSGYEGDIRYTYTKSLQNYILDFNDREEERLDLYNLKEEYIMLHLRTRYGISLKDYEQKFNINFLEEFNNVVKKLEEDNYIEIKNDCLKVKEDKIYVLNSIILKFIECL